jgi:hypothetical protein
MSVVKKNQTSEVGGLQGVFQNLGSSLGTALLGSVLIGSLSTVFNNNIQASALPTNIKSTVSTNSQAGIAVIPVSQVDALAESKGVTVADANSITQIYSESQIEALRTALFALIIIATLSLLFSRYIPDKVVT